MKTGLLTLLLTVAAAARAQFTENFSDGDFTSNPAWAGTTTTFIVNSSHDLQTSAPAAGTSYLATPHGFSGFGDLEWQVRARLVFSPSGSNFARVFLTSTTDLSAPGDGFFLQFGEAGSTDAVRLMKTVGGSETEICAGAAGQIANSFNVRVRVTKDAAGSWSLYVDETGGTNFTLQSTGADATIISGSFFGIQATYTASNANKFHFDDIYAGPLVVDSEPPSMISAAPLSATSVDILFSEIVTGSAIENPANYALSPTASVASALLDVTNPQLVHLSLSAPLINGQNYTLTTAIAEDIAGNQASGLSAGFTYLVGEQPVIGDILISEFMCDPGPAVGLPELEFVEIYNASQKYFDLTGWKLGDASSDGTITTGWIAPGEYKMLCAASSQDSFPGAYSVSSFPSLNNSADDIVLKDTSLAEIDRLSYTDEWYNDEMKAGGGYTLELINPNDPCSDRLNWTASNSSSGGTPGQQNSVYDPAPDTDPPGLISAKALDAQNLELIFDEGMDPISLLNAVFLADPALEVNAVSVISRTSVQLELMQAIQPSTVYSFVYGPAADCWINQATLSGTFALPESAAPGDVIINEILFDPGTGGGDFIELYNRSQKVLNLKDYALASYDNGLVGNIHSISEDYLLYPDDYVALTPTIAYQMNQFPEAMENNLLLLSLPSYNNDSSTVLLLDPMFSVIDKVSYTEDWHLSLIDDTENKTLERIDPAGVSNSSSNWHTAAESINFGTPGRRNSQYQVGGTSGDFSTAEPVFSPDNDGFQDVLLFGYTMPAGEMIASVTIFDDHGRAIRRLMKSELLGISGNFSWDGMNDSGLKSQFGVYLAVLEAFSADGKANFSKRVAFTLAGKLD
jgi:hypothetical protein